MLTDHQHPVAIAITGLFGLLGLYILVGRFLHDSWRRSRLLYAVTDRRVLIVSPSKVRSMDLESLAEMEVKGRRGDSGSISFGPIPGLFSQADLGIWIGKPTVPTFEFIREQRRKAREAASAS